MLTPDQIAALRDAAANIADPINEYLIQDIVRRVAQAGQLTSTAAYQVWLAQNLGVSQRAIKAELRRRLGLSHREIRRVMYQSAQSGYSLDVRRFPQVQAVPFEQNASLQQIVSAAVELAQNDFTNLTQTLGMVDPYGRARPLQSVYRACTDFAFQQTVTGAASYTEAIRQATRKLADKGVQVIDYQSGASVSLEAAVRRNIMGGLGLMQERISQQVHDDLGCDGWEITAHANSAPDHEPIQGRQYSDAEYQALNASLVRRIGTLNCGHVAFPILLGVNRPQYTPEELEKLRADNEKGVTVDGKHYTGYEATQMQRKLERNIRAQKRRIVADEAAGDEERLAQDKIRLTVLHQHYAGFSHAAGLRTQYERTEVAELEEKRIPNGTTEMAPADTTFEEWKDKFVNRGGKDGLTSDLSDGKLNINTESVESRQGPAQTTESVILDDAQVEAKAKALAKDLESGKKELVQGQGDKICAFINRELGYDALPQVVSADEFAALAEGKSILYRGLTPQGDITVEQMANELKYGKFYAGKGVYGCGTYVCLRESKAAGYANRRGPGVVVEMLLADDAKIVDYREIFIKYRAAFNFKILPPQNMETWQRILEDVGKYAALKGYDAIAINEFQMGHDYFVILNRKKLIIKE